MDYGDAVAAGQIEVFAELIIFYLFAVPDESPDSVFQNTGTFAVNYQKSFRTGSKNKFFQFFQCFFAGITVQIQFAVEIKNFSFPFSFTQNLPP